MHLDDGDELLTVREAAAILSRNAGHTVNPDYVHTLASAGKLIKVPLDGRTSLYKRSEVETIVVSNRPGRKKKGESS